MSTKMIVLGLDNKPKTIVRFGYADYMQEAERLIELRWGKHRKRKHGAQKFKDKIGFYLQAHFSERHWRLGDCNEPELIQVIEHQKNRLSGQPCCEKHQRGEPGDN